MNYYDEPYFEFEPSEMDKFYGDILSKVKDKLSDDIKQHIKSLEQREQVIKKQLDVISSRSGELNKKERELNDKEYKLNLDFKKMKISEIVDSITDVFKTDIYIIKHQWIRNEKCNKCDSNRNIEIDILNALKKKIKVECECAESFHSYSVIKDDTVFVKVWKDSEDKFIKVIRNRNDGCELKKVIILDEFKGGDEDCDYDECYGFTSKEEAQKYADFKTKSSIKE